MASRRDEIVETAAELFATRGFEATSMRDIAAASGILASSLYSHFKSRAELLTLTVRPLLDDLDAEQVRVGALDAPGIERLREMVRAVLTLCARHHRAVTILHYSWPHIRATAELADLVAANADVLKQWEQVIAAGVADGSIRADIDTGLVARLITSAIQGLSDAQRYDDPIGLVGRQGVDRLYDDISRLLLDSLVPSASYSGLS